MNTMDLLRSRWLGGFSWIRDAASRLVPALIADRAGAAAITFALSFTSLIGLAALATEVGEWYVAKRVMQGAADAAAYSAATSKASGSASGVFTDEAKSISGGYGYVDGTNNVIVTVNSPPT